MEYDEIIEIETPNKVHTFKATKNGLGKDWLEEVY
jgi:hypothetical protein